MTSYDANGAPVEGEGSRKGWIGNYPICSCDEMYCGPEPHRPGCSVTTEIDGLRAAVQRLSEQLAAAKRDYAIMDETDKAYTKAAHAELASLRTQLSAATAALEAAQKDAERFQWWFIKRHRLYMFGASDRHDPDAAIDAAQREGGGE